jgi:hypothetical protein
MPMRINSSDLACLSFTSSTKALISHGRMTAAMVPPEDLRVSRDAILALLIGNAGDNGSTPFNWSGSVSRVGMTIFFAGSRQGARTALIASLSNMFLKSFLSAPSKS